MEDTDRRYVVGVDGSAESREALRWASRIASVLGGEIVAVHALGLLERVGGEVVSADAHRSEIADLVRRDWCMGAGDSVTSFRVVVRDGSPIDVLAEVARDEHATLLIVGSRVIGAAPALALGSTSLHMLQCAPAPVLVVPGADGGRSHLGLHRILVAVDGATCPDAALDMAARFAAAFGARVELVHVMEDVPVFALGPATTVSVAGEVDVPACARSMLEPIRRRLEDRGVPTRVRVRRGHPAEELRSVAAGINADLVLLTSSHVGEDGGSLLGGSVSRCLSSMLHRAVLVVSERPGRAAIPPRRRELTSVGS